MTYYFGRSLIVFFPSDRLDWIAFEIGLSVALYYTVNYAILYFSSFSFVLDETTRHDMPQIQRFLVVIICSRHFVTFLCFLLSLLFP